MKTCTRIAALRQHLAARRSAGEQIALVPTMGNLHAGHLALVHAARQQAGCVVASIFVNPLQFGEGEDLDRYPRTLQADCERLQAAGCDVLFAPDVDEIYPRDAHGRGDQTFVEVPQLGEILCGAHRPGHFRGVATVVNKLFNIVQPDVALFGEKDYQQLQVIRRMCTDLNLPVRLLGLPTVRETDGLAMSSRNAYLSAGQRARAAQLYAVLQQTAAALQEGRRDWQPLENHAAERLQQAGFDVDYVSIRHQDDLAPPANDDRRLVILAAARLGNTRLIDNLQIALPEGEA